MARIECADAKRGTRKPYENADPVFVKGREGPPIEAMRGVEGHLVADPTMRSHTIVPGQLPVSERLPRPLNHGRGNISLKLARCERALQCFTVRTSTPDMMIRQGRKLRRHLRTKNQQSGGDAKKKATWIFEGHDRCLAQG